MNRAIIALSLILITLMGVVSAQGEPRRWPVSATERLALEALEARERALTAEREAFAREVAKRLGIDRAALCLDGKAGVWFESVAPTISTSR